MKSKLSNFYSEYFSRHKAFVKKYFSHSKVKAGVPNTPVYKRNRNNYLAGATVSKKVFKLLNKNDIRIGYAETRKQSRLRPSEFIEYGQITQYHNGRKLRYDIDISYSSEPFRIYIDDINSLAYPREISICASFDNITYSLEFVIKVTNESYMQVPIYPEVQEVLNSLIDTNFTISEELNFQYSLLHEDFELYVHCCKILHYLYSERIKSNKITAFTLYNIPKLVSL